MKTLPPPTKKPREEKWSHNTPARDDVTTIPILLVANGYKTSGYEETVIF